MEVWSVQIDNVDSATGALTQLYPDWVTAGQNPGTAGNIIRRPTDGILHELSIYPNSVQGGILELWDLAGEMSGTNDVSSADQMTNTYLTAQLARINPRAKLIWKQEFKADAGLTTKKFTQRVQLKFGLAVRWITAGVTANTETCILNVVSEGLYNKVMVQG
jgi:hypothetical protein